MRTAASLVLAVLLMFRAGAAEQDRKKAADKKPLNFALTKVPLKKGVLRPGHEVRAELPPQAWQARIGSDTVLFVDLDGNDEIVPGTDGLAMPSAGPFVVLMPETLLLKAGQFKLAFDGTKQLVATPEDLGAAQAYVADAAAFTEIRLRAGLRPAALDPQMCLDCDKHADYLKTNGLHEGGGSAHDEDPSKPGYTAEGQTAGMNSNVSRKVPELRRALVAAYCQPYHGMTYLMPGTDKIGVTTKNAVSMLYVSNFAGFFGEPFVHPPDGAVGIPTAFGNGDIGESPNPVPGNTTMGLGAGFPIIVMLGGRYTDIESAELVDGAGRPVKGAWSTPAKPANPARPDNKGCVYFIPAKPLSPNTLHKATIKFPGGDKPLTSTFTTAAK